MAAFSSFTLNDGQATPIAHTFFPASQSAGITKWADKVGGIQLGYPTITQSLREPTKDSPTCKVVAKVVLPVLEVTSPSTATGIQPAPTKAFEMIANIDVIIPTRATAAQKADMYAYLKNYINLAVFGDAIKLAEPIW